MNDDRIEVAALREALGWTQQQLADYCDTDRSTVSKWESEPPTKGPALILLRQLRDRAPGNCSTHPVAGRQLGTSSAEPVAQPERSVARNLDDFDTAITPQAIPRGGVVAGPVLNTPQAGTGLYHHNIQETAE
jgi:transcriptional regulator with XRE-family HTH domain